MSTDIGRNWVARIPSLSDDANIQEAFRMYHYGTQDGSEPAPEDTLAAGIEKHLNSLQEAIDLLTAGADEIKTDLDDNNDVDLNNLDTPAESGTYRRSSAAPVDKNYPEPAAGILSVIATAGGAVYQIYQTLGGSSGTNNYYWRGRDAGANWSTWAQGSKVGHNHNTTYYQKTEIDARVSNSITADRAMVSEAVTGKIVSSIVTAEELGHLSGVNNNIQDQLNDRYEKSETARVFVQQTTPSSPQVNDLWIW